MLKGNIKSGSKTENYLIFFYVFEKKCPNLRISFVKFFRYLSCKLDTETDSILMKSKNTFLVHSPERRVVLSQMNRKYIEILLSNFFLYIIKFYKY